MPANSFLVNKESDCTIHNNNNVYDRLLQEVIESVTSMVLRFLKECDCLHQSHTDDNSDFKRNNFDRCFIKCKQKILGRLKEICASIDVCILYPAFPFESVLISRTSEAFS